MTNAARLLAAAEALVLLTLVWTRFLGFRDHVDLHPWDELGYYWAGVDLVSTGVLPSLAWAPHYSLAYGCLAWLPFDAHAPDVMLWICAATGTLLLWAAMRVVVPSPIAVLAAAWYAASPVLLQTSSEGPVVMTGVYAFNAIFAFLGMRAMASGRTWMAFTMLVLVALLRAENLPWLLAFASGAAFLPPMRERRRSAVAMLLIALGLAILIGVSADHRDRAWMAFSQSYGRQACLQDLAEEWVRLEGRVDPDRARRVPFEIQAAFDVPDHWIERDFQGARTVAGALWQNPEAFLGMVSKNVKVLPFAVDQAWSTTLLPVPWSSRLLAVAVVLALGGWWRGRRLPSVPRDDARRLLPWFLMTSPLVLAVPLCVSSRPELALPTVTLVAWFVGRGVADLAPSWWQRRSVAVATIALSLSLALAVPGPFRGPAEPMQFRDGVALLREHLPRHEVRLMSTFWAPLVRLIPRSDVISVELRACGQETLAACLAAGEANAVLVTPQFEHESARFPDGLAPLHTEPWQLVAQRGDCRLYTR